MTAPFMDDVLARKPFRADEAIPMIPEEIASTAKAASQ
jgi:hypothetical protein